MKLHPEDPRLTSLLLGELPQDEAELVERAIAADPALTIAFEELQTTHRVLSSGLDQGELKLYARQRSAVLSAARYADKSGKVTPLRSGIKSPVRFLVPLAAAALVTLAILLLVKLPASDTRTTAAPDPDAPQTLAMEIALLPAPGPVDYSADPAARPTASSSLIEAATAHANALNADGGQYLRKIARQLSSQPTPDAAVLPPLVPRKMVAAAEHPTLQLPIRSGRSSLAWITHSIRQKHELPPSNAIRLEEMLNHFELRPAGSAAIAQGVTLSAETISCPWKPSASLVVVSLRGAKTGAREITAKFNAFPAAVRSYRLLGFAPVEGLPAGNLPNRLPEKSVTTLVLEIEPAAPTGDLGAITWTVGGHDAPPVYLSPDSPSEPSDDARFAALVCTYALWLIGDQAGMLDAEVLAALARETATETLSADRADFLNLIDQSLNR